MRNLRIAARLLARQPIFTITAVLSMAVGIGANTAIFTAVNALLLAEPAGVTEYSRVVDIGRTTRGSGFDTVGYQTYLDVQARTPGLAGVAGYTLEPRAMSLAGAGSAERIFTQQVSGNYFDVVGVRPHLGRLFTEQDTAAGVKNPIVVLSHAFWQTRFQSDRDIAGKTITLSGEPFQVAGVTPPGFEGTSVMRPDIWVPLTAMTQGLISGETLRGRGSHFMMMIGRLAPDASIEQVQSGLDVLITQLRSEHREVYDNRGFAVQPATRIPGAPPAVGAFMGILMALVGLVLMIACVNLAGMQLARATARTREIAVRLALGASRRQIIGQLMAESLMLCAAGGVLGFIAGQWMVRALWGLLPPIPFPLALDFTPDLRVLTFTIAASAIAGLLTGLVPAFQSTKPALVPALKDDAKTPARLRMRHVFVGGQLALSIVLLLAAMLFLRAFKSALDVNPGFDASNVVTASLDLNLAGYTEETAEPFYRQLLEQARAIPGATAAALAIQVPLDGNRFGMGNLELPERPGEESVQADWNIVSPGFFELLRMPMAEGRTFTDADREGVPLVAIVNEQLAERAWPGQSAIGRTLIQGNRRLTVVGVARDARLHIIGNLPQPYIFVPIYQTPFMRAEILVRHDASVASSAIAAPLRQTVRAINPYLPVVSTSTVAEVAEFGMVPQRLAATLAGTLGVAGLLLAAIGLYGLMSYAVAARRREIGIRQALGADRALIVRLFVRQGMKLAAVGATIGIVLGLGLAFAIESLLFGVSPLDPIALGATAGAMLLVGFAASYFPARRASGITPLAALRSE